MVRLIKINEVVGRNFKITRDEKTRPQWGERGSIEWKVGDDAKKKKKRSDLC